jgi:hypothetical protein
MYAELSTYKLGKSSKRLEINPQITKLIDRKGKYSPISMFNSLLYTPPRVRQKIVMLSVIQSGPILERL